ncbi:MAG: hypothetical protein HZB13_16575, partial [Acidobacteria bacterium]|nr:hypothetical protein [Acidobacteriota bacterium]
SGWGSGGASGWGSGGNAQGGWNNSWGNDINYRGRGNGNFDRDGGPRYDIAGVDVRVDRRAGQVDVALDTNDGRGSLTFAGRVQRVDGDTIHVNIDRAVNRGDSVNASATMRIGISGNRRVRSIDLDGRIGGNRSSLNWRD